MPSHPNAAAHSDVLVIGGGPAGTTAATLLRRKGWTVTLVEKDRHPRFHIGESLLPRNMPILRDLGVGEKLAEIGVLKRGADFSADVGDQRVLIDFSKALQADEPTAFQVKRAEFDEMLLRNAEANGVTVHEETTVTSHTFTDGGGVAVTARDRDGVERTLTGKFLIDASGRDTYLSSRLNLKGRNPRHNSAAVFSHFDNVPRRPGDEVGNISIYWFAHGWFWMIPLRDGRMSVGMVCWPKYLKTRTGTLDEFFWQGVALSEPVAARLKDATAVNPLTATGNFSYSSSSMTGDRYLLVGDAYAFIDPVFSSGVYLAMQGATFAAEAVDGLLRQPDRAKAHLKTYEKRVKSGLKIFSWFIYRFTSPAMQALFLKPSDRFGMKAAITSVLAGDVYGRIPLGRHLAFFKVLYAIASVFTWKQARAYRSRLDGAPNVATETAPTAK